DPAVTAVPGAPPTLYPTGPCVPHFDQPFPTEAEPGTYVPLTGNCLDGGTIDRTRQGARLGPLPITVAEWTAKRIMLVIPTIETFVPGESVLTLCVSGEICYESPILLLNYSTGGNTGAEYIQGRISIRLHPGADIY